MRRNRLALILVVCAVAAGGPSRGQNTELERLGRRYEELQGVYTEALKTAKTPEERTDIHNRLAPDRVLLNELFALEEKERGGSASIGALHWILARAMSFGDPEHPISRARTRVVGILRAHYLGHEDLDLFLNGFEAGVHVPEAEALLRSAIESPHRRVRAAARYELASWLGDRATGPAQGRQMLALLAHDPENHREEIERCEHSLKKFGPSDKADEDRARAEAVGLLETIARDDADVPQARVMLDGPGRFQVRRLDGDEAAKTGARRYGELAEALRFEVTRLAVGQVAPEVAGCDADGREFTLADYRGRVVVLMFSANWCGPCKAMYPDNRKLVETCRGRPFAFLGIMGDHANDTVLEAYENSEINWRVCWEGTEGPTVTRWNVHSWPTIYVLDHKGVIRYRDLRGDRLALAVAGLEEEWSRDPDAPALLAAHPVPEETIPARVRDAQAKHARATLALEFSAGGRRAEGIALGRGGKLLLTAGWNETDAGMDAWRASKAKGVVQLWDAATGNNLATFEGSCGAIFSVAVAPDGTLAATAGRVRDDPKMGEVKLWDVASRRERATLAGHTNWVLSAAFSPDGKLLATGGFDRTVKLWDIASAQEVTTLPPHPSIVNTLAFRSDGKLLAVALRNGLVKLWETATWTEQATLENRDFFLLDAALSPDGKKLAVAGLRTVDERPVEAEARVWDVAARKIDTIVPMAKSTVGCAVAFSPDDRLLAIVNPGSMVKVWDLAESKEHALIKKTQGSSADRVLFVPATEGNAATVVFTTHPGTISFWKIAE